jgi:hypothetical protein
MKVDIRYLTEKKDMIAVYDGLIDPAVCDRLITELRPIWDNVSWDGETGGGLDQAMKSSRDCALSVQKIGEGNWNDKFEIIERQIVEGLTSAVAWYQAEFQALHELASINDTGFQLQQYPQYHGFYRQHVDSIPAHWSSNRVLGCVVYLNTVEVGGETEFPIHKAAVNPVAGRIVLFPATFTHPHVGRPALSDDKWIISTFMVNMVTNDESPSVDIQDAFNNKVHDYEHGHEDELSHSHFDSTCIDDF